MNEAIQELRCMRSSRNQSSTPPYATRSTMKRSWMRPGRASCGACAPQRAQTHEGEQIGTKRIQGADPHGGRSLRSGLKKGEAYAEVVSGLSCHFPYRRGARISAASLLTPQRLQRFCSLSSWALGSGPDPGTDRRAKTVWTTEVMLHRSSGCC